jgi:hypothetical protein
MNQPTTFGPSVLPPDDTITFVSGTQGKIFTLKSNGEIIKHEGFTTNEETALAFWDVVTSIFPTFKQQILNEAIQQEAARGKETVKH